MNLFRLWDCDHLLLHPFIKKTLILIKKKKKTEVDSLGRNVFRPTRPVWHPVCTFLQNFQFFLSFYCFFFRLKHTGDKAWNTQLSPPQGVKLSDNNSGDMTSTKWWHLIKGKCSRTADCLKEIWFLPAEVRKPQILLLYPGFPRHCKLFGWVFLTIKKKRIVLILNVISHNCAKKYLHMEKKKY